MSKKMTKSDIVYNHLKEQILSGTLKPNERLVINTIAKELDVSPIPVREALKKLSIQGFIEFESQKGAKVAPINIDDLQEIFEIRLELETLATKLAARHATDEEIANLQNICEKMESSIRNKNTQQYTQLNREFHDSIYSYSKNRNLRSEE